MPKPVGYVVLLSIILVSADESVVAKIPALTSILENATSLIIRWFETSSAEFGDRPTGIL